MALLLETLPSRIDIHCAKIAGRHIFWHAPFIAPLESPQSVLNAGPGTFLYWPERQFLELIYGELQAESAQVTILGHLTGPVDWLTRLGSDVTQYQGDRRFWATLSRGAVPEPRPAPRLDDCPHAHAARKAHAQCNRPVIESGEQPDLLVLRDAGRAAWLQEPDCLRTLVARRGIMLPYGPLAMAEGEFRKLQELLWGLYSAMQTAREGIDAPATGHFLIHAFLGRIVGLCGLEESGHILRLAALLLRTRPADAQTVLEETILYCGRMAAWLDLAIPWHRLNKAVLESQSVPRLSDGEV